MYRTRLDPESQARADLGWESDQLGQEEHAPGRNRSAKHEGLRGLFFDLPLLRLQVHRSLHSARLVRNDKRNRAGHGIDWA